jgi:hypothetical protein
MGTLRRSKQRTDAFLLARPAGSLSNFKESSKRACSQAKDRFATKTPGSGVQLVWEYVHDPVASAKDKKTLQIAQI